MRSTEVQRAYQEDLHKRFVSVDRRTLLLCYFHIRLNVYYVNMFQPEVTCQSCLIFHYLMNKANARVTWSFGGRRCTSGQSCEILETSQKVSSLTIWMSLLSPALSSTLMAHFLRHRVNGSSGYASSNHASSFYDYQSRSHLNTLSCLLLNVGYLLCSLRCEIHSQILVQAMFRWLLSTQCILYYFHIVCVINNEPCL